MKCPNCNHENREQRKFCSHCANPLDALCPSCQAHNEPGDRFCGGCAAALPDLTSADTVARPRTSLLDPVSFSDGRYEVTRYLGEGKSKRVYMVHDTVLDRDVALALLKTDGIDQSDRQRILREGQTMARLGEHPNVMPIYDLGFDNGLPFIVMPLMSGGSIESLQGGNEPRRLDLPLAMRIAIGVCNGLVFAHSRGIVHRDLKPGNVWLTDEQTPRIGDFGLALSRRLDRLTSPDMVIGTPVYMSPEQITGENIDGRTDLYSLGVMLYEMVAGTPPFSGDSHLAVIGQHLNATPVSPTWYNDQCPEPLQTLILGLLEKDPADRPESADSVLTALNTIGASITGVLPKIASPMRIEMPEFARDRAFVGRDEEMERLRDILQDSLAGRGHLTVVVGEPGVGKTRTAQELESLAASRSVGAAWGRCYEEQGMPPYWPWVQVIRTLLRDSDQETVVSALGSGAPEIAEIVAEVRAHVPDLGSPVKVDNPRYARFRLFESLAAFFTSIASSRPLLIILDDLQWADQPSLLFLEFLAGELGDSAILLVGMYRDVDLPRQHPLTETLGAIAREPHFARVVLKDLDEPGVGKLIQVAAHISPTPDLVSSVYEQTEGNPLFVTEIVKLLSEEGGLESGDGIGVGMSVPDGVRDVIGRRLNHLPPEVIGGLTTASVIGHEFGLYEVKSVVNGAPTEDLLDAMDKAVLSGIVEEVSDSPGRYRFTHRLTQQVLAEGLSRTRRTMLHARIGEALEGLYGDDMMAHAAELARHFGAAAPLTGAQKQIEYCILAGEHALATYAYEEALSQFQTAFEAKVGQDGSSSDVSVSGDSPDIDRQTAEILYGLGRSQRATATFRMQDAWATLSMAFEYNLEAGDIPQVVDVAEHLPVTEHMRTTELLARALNLVPSGSHLEGRLLSRYGNALNFEKGDFDGARDAFHRALTIARQVRDPALEMRTITNAACLDGEHLRIHDSLEKSLRTVELARHVPNPQAELLARFWAATAHYSLGESSHAVAHAAACLDLADRLKVPSQLATAIWTNETLARMKGDWDTARAYSDQGLELSPRDCRLLSSRVLVECQTGDQDEGRLILDRLIDVMRQEEAGADLEFALPAITVPLVVQAVGDCRHLGAAEEAARTVLSAESATPSLALLARAGLALAAVARGDASEAYSNYSFLLPYRGTMLYGGLGAVDRMLALIAIISGRFSDADSHFRDAASFCRKACYWPELAWTTHDHAVSLTHRVHKADRHEATAMLDETIRICEDLGMRALEDKARSHRALLAA